LRLVGIELTVRVGVDANVNLHAAIGAVRIVCFEHRRLDERSRNVAAHVGNTAHFVVVELCVVVSVDTHLDFRAALRTILARELCDVPAQRVQARSAIRAGTSRSYRRQDCDPEQTKLLSKTHLHSCFSQRG
jgi:hypothetical protein